MQISTIKLIPMAYVGGPMHAAAPDAAHCRNVDAVKIVSGEEYRRKVFAFDHYEFVFFVHESLDYEPKHCTDTREACFAIINKIYEKIARESGLC